MKKYFYLPLFFIFLFSRSMSSHASSTPDVSKFKFEVPNNTNSLPSLLINFEEDEDENKSFKELALVYSICQVLNPYFFEFKTTNLATCKWRWELIPERFIFIRVLRL